MGAKFKVGDEVLVHNPPWKVGRIKHVNHYLCKENTYYVEFYDPYIKSLSECEGHYWCKESQLVPYGKLASSIYED